VTKPHQALSGVCLTLSLMAASVSAVASGPGKIEQQKMEGAIAAAKAAIKGAKSVGFEWRDSGKILKQAEVAMAEGNVDKALSLAAKAQFQGEAGQAQAVSQANASPRFETIIRNIHIYEQEMAMAKSAQKVAADAGFEWRDLGKVIKKAEKAAAKGQLPKAIKLAKKAHFQGEAGQAQAINQASAAPRFDAIIEKMNAFDQEIAAAEQARKGAAKVGFEWRDTGKMIKKARTAANSSHYDKAIKLAKKARFQGEAGQQQAKGQASAGPRF